MNLRFKNVLFDLDGTLIDPAQGIPRSIQYALEKLGQVEIPEQAELLWTIGPPLQENLAKLIETDDPEIIEQGMSFYRDYFGEVGIFENEIYPQVPEFLAGIKQMVCHLFLTTSKPHPYAVRIMDQHQLTPFFDHIYGSEFDGTRGDKGQLIKYVLKEEGLKVEHSLMVGDRMYDIWGAKQNNMAAAGVTYGYGSIEELTAAGADYLVHTLEELTDVIRGEQ
jgi:phosphoglycolate phosphatase